MEERPVRKQIRLSEYDHSTPGYYFITICTHQRQPLFSEAVGADLCVGPPDPPASPPESIPQHWRLELGQKYPGAQIDCYAVMADHVHFILVIPGGHIGPPLQEMIQWYKTQTTNAYIRAVKAGDAAPFLRSLWQRGYYDHIIRSDADLSDTRRYITGDPNKKEESL